MRYDYDSYIGKVFGRLKVLSWYRRSDSKAIAVCRCNCGNLNAVEVYFSLLLSGNTKSCGCLKKESTTLMNKGKATFNGESVTRLYRCYKSMMYRCYNTKCKDYSYYGGRGISVCRSWNDYGEFKKWAINNGYSDNLTLDRIDVDGNYSPENCRWITIQEQQKNKRHGVIITSNLILTYLGKSMSMKEWAEYLSIPYRTLRSRYLRGWGTEKILTTAVSPRNKILSFNGEEDTVNNWACRFNVPPSTFKNRLYANNYDIAKIVDKYNMKLINEKTPS